MADIYDVQVALANLAQTAVYPNGLSQPSVANCDVRIYPGNPIPDTLDADLIAQKAHVSIFPTNIARVSTRFQTDWYTTQVNTPTLVMTTNLNAGTVTITGTVSTPQSCMIIYNSIGYSYGVQSGDTLNSIASNLASIITGATSTGNVVTLINPHLLSARVIIAGTGTREVAREKRLVLTTVWAPTPLIRSQIGYAIAVLFASTYRVALPDGYYGQLVYSGSQEKDDLEKVICYRRNIHFIFEFATTQAMNEYTIGDNIINISQVASI
jgi:hypothetical protein